MSKRAKGRHALRAVTCATLGTATFLSGASAVAAGPLASPAKPRVSYVTAAYAGSTLSTTARFCDQSVRSRVKFRMTWRAYRVDDGRLWKSGRSTISSSSRCNTVGINFRNAPQFEDHYVVLVVSNLATGRSGRGKSARGVTT